MDKDNFAIHWEDPPAGPVVRAYEFFDPPYFNVYLASALTGREDNQQIDTEVRKTITDAFENYDYLGLSCKVYDPATHTAPGSSHSSETVYLTDQGQTANSDLVVFYLNAPSDGRGAESQIAADACVPRIIIRPEGQKMSRMFQGLFNPTLCDIEFKNIEDLKNQLSERRGDICGELYCRTPERRHAVSNIMACDFHKFFFTQRLLKNISISDLSKATGIQTHWLTEVERDSKKCAVLTIIQLELIAAHLDAQLGINEGRMQMIPKENTLPRQVRESLDNLHTFVITQTKPIADEVVMRHWRDYVENDVEPTKVDARIESEAISVDDWKKRFQSPTLF